jgi:micrococcal nuclease
MMRLLKPYFLIITIFLSINVCSTSENSHDKLSQQNQSIQPSDSVYVTQVFDGDTFVLSSGETVRIALIDTPESGEPLYDEAGQYLSGLILGKKVTLMPLGSGTDHYGRTLAEVFIDTINVGYSVLQAGMAYLYLYRENIHLKEVYLQAQKQAITAKSGIWALPDPVPEKYYINLKGSFRFHRPLCTHLKKANLENIRRIGTRIEALNKGLSPCRTCRP